MPETAVPFAKNVTVPPGTAPRLCAETGVPTVRFAPACANPIFGALIVVGAGIMLYVVLAVLALKLLSPG